MEGLIITIGGRLKKKETRKSDKGRAYGLVTFTWEGETLELFTEADAVEKLPPEGQACLVRFEGRTRDKKLDGVGKLLEVKPLQRAAA
jgi:hypothetical protein